jgi:hypothetical protein
VTSDDLEETDYEHRMSDLIKQMESMSAEQLQDAVHWQREFKICRSCQIHFIRDPLGTPAPDKV